MSKCAKLKNPLCYNNVIILAVKIKTGFKQFKKKYQQTKLGTNKMMTSAWFAWTNQEMLCWNRAGTFISALIARTRYHPSHARSAGKTSKKLSEWKPPAAPRSVRKPTLWSGERPFCKRSNFPNLLRAPKLMRWWREFWTFKRWTESKRKTCIQLGVLGRRKTKFRYLTRPSSFRNTTTCSIWLTGSSSSTTSERSSLWVRWMSSKGLQFWEPSRRAIQSRSFWWALRFFCVVF